MSKATRVMDRPSGVEFETRREGFLGGGWVQLADGQEWAFPGPEEIAGDRLQRNGVAALLRAIGEAEDDAERRRGELALAIKLLAVNYDLSPEMFQRILGRSADARAAAAMQAAFRDLARRHAEALWPRRTSPNPDRADGWACPGSAPDGEPASARPIRASRPAEPARDSRGPDGKRRQNPGFFRGRTRGGRPESDDGSGAGPTRSRSFGSVWS